MPLIDRVDARIHVNGEPLREHRDPAGDLDGEHSRVRYVEGAVGQRFSIIVRLLGNFQLKHKRWFTAEYRVDDGDIFFYKTSSQGDLDQRNGYLKTPHTMTISGTTRWDDAIGKFMSCGFEFGPLGTTEKVCSLKSFPTERTSKIGSIRVKFFRAKRVRLERAETCTGQLDSVSEVPELALKGRDIKMNTKYVSTTEVTSQAGPAPMFFDFVPVDGSHGEIYEFTFLYRTRKALQSLGCIEPSPTPTIDPDAQRVIDRQRDVIENLQTELERFTLGRARPEIKKEPGVKHSSTTGLAGPVTPAGHETDDEFELVEVTPPPKPVPVVIDLTNE